MHNKCIAGAVAAVVIVGAVTFFGGMKYDASQKQAQFSQQRGGFGQGMMNGGPGGQRGPGRMGAGGANGGAGNFAGGQIVAKDTSSITIKTRNGGSQIIFFSPSTTVDKSVAGDASDLDVGQQITANGTANPDGTLAAQVIQIRPDQQSVQPGQ